MNKLFLLLTISIFLFSSCQKEAVIENVAKNEVSVKKTIEGNQITYQAIQNDNIISSLILSEKENGQFNVEAGFDNSTGNFNNIFFNSFDENGNLVSELPLIKNENVVNKEEWLHIAAIIILWCVDGEISYSQSGGWSGSIGFDCYAIAPPMGEIDYPKTYTPNFSIKAN